MPKAKTEINKVGSKTDPGKLAGAIAGETRENKDSLKMRINAIGAGAVNQAVKALAIAQGYLMGTGWVPAWSFRHHSRSSIS